MEWSIGHAIKCKSILDPDMGSGTTLIAAQRHGIRVIGFEMHEPYYAAAVERLTSDQLR